MSKNKGTLGDRSNEVMPEAVPEMLVQCALTSFTPDWQVDMGAYELKVPIARSDLTRYLDGQPLQFMLKDRQGFHHISMLVLI